MGPVLHLSPFEHHSTVEFSSGLGPYKRSITIFQSILEGISQHHRFNSRMSRSFISRPAKTIFCFSLEYHWLLHLYHPFISDGDSSVRLECVACPKAKPPPPRPVGFNQGLAREQEPQIRDSEPASGEPKSSGTNRAHSFPATVPARSLREEKNTENGAI